MDVVFFCDCLFLPHYMRGAGEISCVGGHEGVTDGGMRLMS